jgi:hypothetical protein
MFTDETHFFVQGYRKTVVQRSQAEPLRTGHHQQTVKHPPEKMFGACFTSIGPGNLVFIEGIMNSEKYSDITKRRVVPAVEKNFPNGNGIIQHDLAPCHTSRK